MSITQKHKEEYWQQFSSYQTFSTFDEMNDQIKKFVSIYDLTPAVKAVLNTIKLYAKRTFIGVCWLYRDEIARKAKVSLSSVKRAIKELREVGILTVHPFTNTKKGGKAHNIYVINPIFETSEKPSNEPSDEAPEEASSPCPASDSASDQESYKNPHTNSNKKQENHLSIKKAEELKFIPSEFIDLMEPFYANDPEIIRDRWKTVCIAAKRSCLSMKNASFDTIGQAWKDVVRFYKRGKIKNATDDGIGGYFYSVLCDYLLNDFLKTQLKI